jgi:hypothetical protein
LPTAPAPAHWPWRNCSSSRTSLRRSASPGRE